MQPMTLAAALMLSPGNKAYREMEDGTLVVAMQHEDYDGAVIRAMNTYYQIKDGTCSGYTGLMSREALVWLPLEALYVRER